MMAMGLITSARINKANTAAMPCIQMWSEISGNDGKSI